MVYEFCISEKNLNYDFALNTSYKSQIRTTVLHFVHNDHPSTLF